MNICFSVLDFAFGVYFKAARSSIMPFELDKAKLYHHCMTDVMLWWMTGNLPPSFKPWMLRELHVREMLCGIRRQITV